MSFKARFLKREQHSKQWSESRGAWGWTKGTRIVPLSRLINQDDLVNDFELVSLTLSS